MLEEIIPEPGAFYVMDRGYIDFERLYGFTLSAAFFVVRTKKNILLERRYSHQVDKSTGVRSDQTVILTAGASIKVYPDALRRVSYIDPETNKRLAFLTNNFVLTALIYRADLQVVLASGTLLQMDQTASANQGVPRSERERGEDPDLDRSIDIRTRRHRQEASRDGSQPLPDSTDSQPVICPIPAIN
jgi:hypothetical protein